MEHKELLAQRITDIIIKLNAGEILSIDQLSDEFGVSKRTIQRDINTRLAFLPLERSGNKVSLCKTALGKLSKQDINNFAQICGIDELFPNLDSHFITSLLSNAYRSPYMVTGNEFEHEKEAIKVNLKKLERFINNQQLIVFEYKNKHYQDVSSYKLINHNQVWYLAAIDHGKLKTFHVGWLKAIFSLDKTFTHNKDILKQIDQGDGIYIAEDKTEVVLKVSTEVAHYFKRRQLLPEQKIDKELETGELIVSSHIAYHLQIIPLIKYWMPHLQVISPKGIEEQVVNDINQFKYDNNL